MRRGSAPSAVAAAPSPRSTSPRAARHHGQHRRTAAAVADGEGVAAARDVGADDSASPAQRSPRRRVAATARREAGRSPCTRRICSVCWNKVTRVTLTSRRSSSATSYRALRPLAHAPASTRRQSASGFHGGRSPTPSISVCSGSSALRPPRGGDARRGGDAPRNRRAAAAASAPRRAAGRSDPLVRMSSSFVAMSASAFCCSDRTPSAVLVLSVRLAQPPTVVAPRRHRRSSRRSASSRAPPLELRHRRLRRARGSSRPTRPRAR